MSERFSFKKAALPDVWIAERKVFKDERGSFARLFCASEFKKINLTKPIVQINQSITKARGTVRGLHFQLPPHAETKIVTCSRGEIFDVAVDLRKGSKTFLKWYGEKLSAENKKSLIIPEGFAHGFQALTDNCEIIYLHTKFYVPEAEGGFNVSDKRVAIKWPMPISGLSARDKSHAFVADDYHGMTV